MWTELFFFCFPAAETSPSTCRCWRKRVWDVSNLKTAWNICLWMQEGRFPVQVWTAATTQASFGTRWSARWCESELVRFWKEHQPVRAEAMCLSSRGSKPCRSSTGTRARTAAGCTSARSVNRTAVCISVTDTPQTTGPSGELLMSPL